MATESKTKTISQAVTEGINLLAQGKRNLLCGEVHQAVNQLEEAAKICSKEYGELANECAEVYFLYGQALLELHRSESNVLEDAQPSESSDEEEEEEEDGDKEVGKLKDAETDDSEDLVDEECTSEGKEGVGQTKRPTDLESSDAIDYKNGEATDENNLKKNDIKENDQGEDVSSLQLSWETLELAKLIYSRQDSPITKLKLSDTYSKLGDVGLEMEQFDEAIKDYKECLNIQKSIRPKDCRRVAETLYQLGIAHTLLKSYNSSIEYFRGSIQVMELRKMRLKQVAEGEIPPDMDEDGDGFYTPIELAAKEVEELAELINEVHSKIEEVEDEEKSAPNVLKLLKESLASTKDSQTQVGFEGNTPASAEIGNGDLSLPQASASTSVHIITHLVRKKKADPETLEQEAKKQKIENVESSNVTSNPTSLNQ